MMYTFGDMQARKRPAAFTLVELLVVIALIAVLLSLLLPALGAIRRQSEQSICLSRLRQVTAACTAYAIDHGGEFPYGKRVNWADHDHYRSWLNGYMWKVLRNRYGMPREAGTCVHANALPEDVGQYDPSIQEYADVAWGWIYWGNRQDILPWGGSRGYRTAKGIGRPGTSPTLLTCIVEDGSEVFWGSVAPHVKGKDTALYYPGHAAFDPKPEKIGVGYVDGSAAFVPFEELTPIREFHTYPMGTLFYHDPE